MARILVVDDDDDTREALSATLREEGHQVIEAADGAAAFNAVLADQPSLIFLDIMMPGSDGFEALKHLRAHPSTRSIPIVVVSARCAIEDRERARVFGAYNYITKPWESGEVERHARWALASRGNPARRVCTHPEQPPLVA